MQFFPHRCFRSPCEALSTVCDNIRRAIGLALEPSAAILMGGAPSGTAPSFLFDFGASGTPISHADAPKDLAQYYNNVPDSIGASATGQLLKLVAANNMASDKMPVNPIMQLDGIEWDR